MSKIPGPINQIQALIDKAHEELENKPRPHLGASLLGHKCDRWLWLSFRWAIQEQFPGRVLRLFRRGHNEEEHIVNDLKMIGINITKTGDDQEFVRFGSHIGGSLDGIIQGGVPGAEKTPHIAEFKTHGKKSFDDLVKKDSVYDAKPMHYAQMQLYMKGTNIKRALYVAVCKDDDRLYIERVKYDEDAANKILERGKKIALSERMPDPLSTDPSWYECKFCAAHSFCHERRLTQHVNCRTCAHVTPTEDSTWTCERWGGKVIPTEYQHTGCDSHVLHPDMVPWPMKDSNNSVEGVFEINGTDVRNGEGDEHVFTSQELIAGGEACANGLVQEVRKTFPDARVEKINVKSS
tara:strand:+ start:234 stop:1283 length:1050 start_codon:yes stop_codon:yes gene_type:complete